MAAIYGRVWNPLNQPAAGAHIIVTDQSLTTIYGESITISKPGPDDASYQITSLPVNQKLLVFVFHTSLPGLIASQEIVLKRNEFRKLNLSITVNFTDPGYITLDGGLGGFITRVINLLKQSQDFRSARTLTDQLNELLESAPADKSSIIDQIRTSEMKPGHIVHVELSDLPGKEKISKGRSGAFTVYSSKERVLFRGEGDVSYCQAVGDPNLELFVITTGKELVYFPMQYCNKEIDAVTTSIWKFFGDNRQPERIWSLDIPLYEWGDWVEPLSANLDFQPAGRDFKIIKKQNHGDGSVTVESQYKYDRNRKKYVRTK